MVTKTTQRGDLLADAITAIEGARNGDYGDPKDNFNDTADLWTIYLAEKLLSGITPADVAALQILLKVARLKHDDKKRDSWMDIAGYAGCGWECAA